MEQYIEIILKTSSDFGNISIRICVILYIISSFSTVSCFCYSTYILLKIYNDSDEAKKNDQSNIDGVSNMQELNEQDSHKIDVDVEVDQLDNDGKNI